jgi:MFS transporter, FSR family, fosmidomycin resistance protein
LDTSAAIKGEVATIEPVNPDEAASDRRREDLRTIGLVGLAHGTSHFFHMMLPPLFPLFVREFGVSYAELGLVTLFFVVSGIGQALAGFLVDRVGARPVLFAALACFAVAALAGAGARDVNGLMLAAALAGLGNSPFHPIDFTILNKRVSQTRLGHAFSVHGISGNLGWAVAPVFQHALIQATGSWRAALLGCAVWAVAVLALLLWQRRLIDDRVVVAAAVKADSGEAGPFAFLRLPSVWLCFSFFIFSTAALSAIQSFAGPALARMYALPIEIAAYVVTGYMLAGVAGMLMGGFIAARVQRLERAVGWCLAGSALLLLLVGTGWLPAMLALVVASAAGVGNGLAGPSRDMLIRQASPAGATGRVYGTVYSGLDIGFALAAPIFGAILDRGHATGVFQGAALSLALGIVCASLVGLRVAMVKRAVA